MPRFVRSVHARGLVRGRCRNCFWRRRKRLTTIPDRRTPQRRTPRYWTVSELSANRPREDGGGSDPDAGRQAPGGIKAVGISTPIRTSLRLTSGKYSPAVRRSAQLIRLGSGFAAWSWGRSPGRSSRHSSHLAGSLWTFECAAARLTTGCRPARSQVCFPRTVRRQPQHCSSLRNPNRRRLMSRRAVPALRPLRLTTRSGSRRRSRMHCSRPRQTARRLQHKSRRPRALRPPKFPQPTQRQTAWRQLPARRRSPIRRLLHYLRHYRRHCTHQMMWFLHAPPCA